MAKRKKILTIHKPGGYEAWKDQMPIRTPNWKAIMFLFGTIFSCGAIIALSVAFVPRMIFQKPSPTPTGIAAILGDTRTVDPAYNVLVSSPQATASNTPTELPSPTSTPEATEDSMLMTVEFMANQLSEIQTQTAQPVITEVVITVTPSATLPPQYESMARVVYNNVIVRAGSTQNSTALTMVYNGETFGVLETFQGWVRVDHPQHEVAWIARHLLRVESNE